MNQTKLNMIVNDANDIKQAVYSAKGRWPGFGQETISGKQIQLIRGAAERAEVMLRRLRELLPDG